MFRSGMKRGTGAALSMKYRSVHGCITYLICCVKVSSDRTYLTTVLANLTLCHTELRTLLIPIQHTKPSVYGPQTSLLRPLMRHVSGGNTYVFFPLLLCNHNPQPTSPPPLSSP